MRSVHIERKTVAPEAAVTCVRDAVRAQLGAWWSAADVAVATGLPLADAEQALLTLSTRHRCRVGVGDDAALRVRFEAVDHPPEPTGLVAWWRRVQAWFGRHRDAVLAIFTVLLLPFATVMAMAGAGAMAHGAELRAESLGAVHYVPLLVGGLVALFWLFVTLGLAFAAIWAFSAVNMMVVPIAFFLTPILDPSERATADFSWSGHIAAALMLGGTMGGMGWALLKPLLKTMKRVLVGEKAVWAQRFWRSAGGMVFGPPHEKVDDLADEKALVARLRELGGVATTADLMGLFGWMPARADSEIMRVMLDYGGDVTVAGNGAILWVFPALRPQQAVRVETTDGRTTTAVPTLPATMAAARNTVYRFTSPPPPRYFGCTRRFAVLTLILMVPSLLGPAVHPWIVAFPSISEFFAWQGPAYALATGDGDPTMQAFGLWPAVLFLVPMLGRVPAWLRRRRMDARMRRELFWIRTACELPDGSWHAFTPEDRRIVAILGGDIDVRRGGDPNGRVSVHFPAISQAFEAAREMRASGALESSF